MVRRLGRAPDEPGEPVIVVPDSQDVESAASLVGKFKWHGFVGTLLMAVGAYGCGWVSQASGIGDAPGLEEIRSSPALIFASKLVVVVGVAVLLEAWLRLGHHVRTRRVTAPTVLTRLAWWWAAPLLFAPVLFSRDVYSYIAQSRLLPHGISPYLYGTGVFDTYFTDGADWMWKTSPAPYGPLWMGLSSGVYRATAAQPIAALLAFRVLALLGVALIAVYLPRLARACGVDPAKAIWLGLLNPLVFMHFVSAAHNDALMIGLLIAGMTYGMERRPWLAILFVTLAGAVKAPALIGLAFTGIAWAGPSSAFARRVKYWALSAASAVGIFLLLNVVTGLDFGWVSSLGTPGRVRTWLSPMTGLGLLTGNGADLVGLGYRVDGAVDFWRDVGTVLTVVIIGWLVLTGHRRSPARGLALSLLALVVLGPVVQPWYLLWALIALAASGLTNGQTRVAVLATTGFVIFGLANSGSTVPTYVFLSDGLAALVAVAVVVGLLTASKRTRAILLEDARPSDVVISL
jgi:alpha-1,6-mannosyltransferase